MDEPKAVKFTVPKRTEKKGGKRNVISICLPRELTDYLKKVGQDQGGYTITEIAKQMILHCAADLKDETPAANGWTVSAAEPARVVSARD